MTKPYPNLKEEYADRDEPVKYEEDNNDCPICKELSEVIDSADKDIALYVAVVKELLPYVPKLVQDRVRKRLCAISMKWEEK